MIHILTNHKYVNSLSLSLSLDDSEMDPPMNRPTVAQFMNELTEVEQQVSVPSSQHSMERPADKPTPRMTASTATAELDELMANLSDFKMPPQKVPLSLRWIKDCNYLYYRSNLMPSLKKNLELKVKQLVI